MESVSSVSKVEHRPILYKTYFMINSTAHKAKRVQLKQNVV